MRAASGFSLIEVLFCLAILGVLLLPIMDLLITSNRAAAAARRTLDSTLYAQNLLESMAELSPEELPDGEGDLLGFSGVPLEERAPGVRWQRVVPDLRAAPPFPLSSREIHMRRVGGNVEISIVVEFLGVPGDPTTRQRIVLRELSVKRPNERLRP